MCIMNAVKQQLFYCNFILLSCNLKSVFKQHRDDGLKKIPILMNQWENLKQKRPLEQSNGCSFTH